MKTPLGGDHVDHVREQWLRQRPDLDTSPIAIVARVGRLARYFDRDMTTVFAEHGVRRESWDALASLRRAGPPFRLSPTALYRGLMRGSGTITNRINRLVQARLVRRVPDESDGRGVLVELTAQGRELVDTLAPMHLDNERAMLAPLTLAEQEQLANLLRKLLCAYELDESPGPP